MKTAIILVLILLLLAGLSAGAFFGFQHLTKPKIVLYQTSKIDTGEIAIVATATGNVEPTRSVKVGSQVSGRVKEVHVEQDDRVTAGQVLAVLDTELMENDIKDKELLLRQSKCNLTLLSIEAAQADLKEERTRQSIERDKINRERTKASMELSAKTFARYTEMVKRSAAAESELDIHRLERDNAERDLNLKALDAIALEQDLKEIGITRRNIAARVQQGELAVEQADQALKRAQTNMTYAILVSPIDGVVIERTVETGQTIAAQFQTPDLFKIAADLKKVLITANIDEIDVGKIKPGQKVSFEVDAFRGEKFSGTVKTLHLKHEQKSNLVSYPVVIEADNPPFPDYPLGKLRPGMTAFLEFDVQHKTGISRIPAAALRFTPPAGAVVQARSETSDKAADSTAAKEKDPSAEKKLPGSPATVYIKDKTGNPTPIPIRVGDSNGQFYELFSKELKPGDEVITGTTEAPAPVVVN